MKTSQKLVICDKNPMIVEGLKKIFLNVDGIEVIGTASDGEMFFTLMKTLCFDLGIIGWEMPHINGREVLQKLKELNSSVKVVVYSSLRIAPEAMRLGASAYYCKTDPPHKLPNILLQVADGMMIFPYSNVNETHDPFSDLTAREFKILGYLAEGKTNLQIAKQSGISINTVKFHLKNLYQKIDVDNRTQAVLYFNQKTRVG